jgi:chaperonin GroEL
VKAPSFGNFRKDILQDLAVLTGGVAITEDLGMKLATVTLQQLGRAKRVTVTKDSTLIVEGYGTKVDLDARIELIKQHKASEQSEFNREKLQERLARLVGGVAVLSMGATTEAELKEKTYRVEDALQATQAAIQEGIVPGGGVAFIKCLAVLDKNLLRADLTKDELVGIAIVRTAIKEPIRRIAANAGKEGNVILEKVMDHYLTERDFFGYNARTDKYEDMFVSGVVDPVKVTRVALENAASIAGLLLTTDCAITEIKKKPPIEVTPGMLG